MHFELDYGRDFTENSEGKRHRKTPAPVDNTSMSIKRTNPKTDRRASVSDSTEGSVSPTARKKEATWHEAMANKSEAEFVNYTIRGRFTPGTLLRHTTFGKGIVLSVDGQKMEVLFADSKKLLAMDSILAPRSPGKN